MVQTKDLYRQLDKYSVDLHDIIQYLNTLNFRDKRKNIVEGYKVYKRDTSGNVVKILHYANDDAQELIYEAQIEYNTSDNEIRRDERRYHSGVLYSHTVKITTYTAAGEIETENTRELLEG